MTEEKNREQTLPTIEAKELEEKMTQADVMNTPNSLKFAGFWMRFWAYLADLIVISSLNRIFIHPIFKFVQSDSAYSFLSLEVILTTIIYFLYFVLMTKFFHQTLGKMIFGLKVVALKEEKVSWGTLIFREFIGRFISKVTIIGYLIVGFMPKKQGLHDIFADTSVVLTRR